MSIGLEEDKKQKPKTTDQRNGELPKSSNQPAKTKTSSSLSSPPPLTSIPPTPSEVFDSTEYNAISEMKEESDMPPDETAKVFSHVEVKQQQQLDTLTTNTNDNFKNANPKNKLKTYSYPDLSNNNNNNPFIIGIKLWQSYSIAWINAYNEFLKSLTDNTKVDSNEFSINHQVSISLSKEMKNILGHIAEMSEANPANNVYDTAIITQSGLSKAEVYNCIDQLERLNLIKINMKKSAETFRIINITQKGVENSSWSEIRDIR